MVLLCCTFVSAKAQDAATQYKAAMALYNNGQYAEAGTAFLALLETNQSNLRYNYYCGLSLLHGKNDRTQAWKYLAKGSDMPNRDADYYYQLGHAYHLGYEFTNAIASYQRYLGSAEDEALLAKAAKGLEDCFTASELMKFPMDVEIQNLGAEVNSPQADYTPFVDDKESMLVFTSTRKRGNQQEEPDKHGIYTSDVYLSAIENGNWKRPKNLGKKVNSPVDDEVIGMATDGSLMFMNIGGRGVAGQMVVSHRQGTTTFKEPIEVEKTINTGAEERTSSVTLDRQTFFFASNRKNGSGKFDLYMTKRLPNNEWGTAVNLGNLVNTPGDELFPQLSPDEKTLFFVSDGHSGMGGFDIFRCQWLEESQQWGAPENMGYPINTPDDEMNFTMCATEKTGYLSGLRPGGQGGLDLYSVTFGEVALRNTLVIGKVQTMVPVDYNNYATYNVYEKNGTTKKMPVGFDPPPDWKFIEQKKSVMRPRFTHNYVFVYERDGKVEEFNGLQSAPVRDPDYKFQTCKRVQVADNFYKPITNRLESAPRPVSDAFISVYDLSTDELVGTYTPVPATGRYVMILPPGMYMLEVEAENCEFYTEEFEVVGKGSFEHRIDKDITLKSTGKPVPMHHSELPTDNGTAQK